MHIMISSLGDLEIQDMFLEVGSGGYWEIIARDETVLVQSRLLADEAKDFHNSSWWMTFFLIHDRPCEITNSH